MKGLFNKIAILLLIIIFCFSLSKKIFAFESTIYADSYVLIEKESKRILAGENYHKKLLPASITKILTCIVAIENGELDKYYKVTKDVTMQTGSSIYLELGEEVKLIDLLYGMMLRSGNDAAYMVSNVVCDNYNSFIDLMNDKAREIGMKNSYFKNPSGLDESTENYSTAYDMAILMAYCLENEMFRKITSTSIYSFENKDGKLRSISNKHKLVKSYDYITGGKTGYTKKAKRTLVTSAIKNDMELIAVTFNCGDDWNVHLNLFDYGFDNYQMKNIIDEGIIEINNLLYEVTPYLPFPMKYPLKDDDKYKVIIYLLNDPNDYVIGKAVVYIDNKKVFIQDIYRYY